ncbi:histidine phosphatase family protein [Vallitalea guaymasensis]|uniref:Histidine phosphatase family protein n=1 Tax=Vallitalea guaymasensis TaxID=1185412 RepID=A0A8J8MDY7_9FIRM|nr:histidine phosphatase family protein [Vallitalea guaymasensis]QUH31069.1 histidine phosphatase family protein [Vallitalea guaymasensis]
MTRLYLTRHGETEWNLIKKVQGSRDSNLTQKGIIQATKLGKYLENTNIDVIYSSSSGRAYNTAKIIAGNRNIEVIKMDDLKEMNLGIWEGKTFEVIKEDNEEMYDTFWNKPHLVKEFPGESFSEFEKRVVGTVLDIAESNKGKDILIVAHALVLKVVMSFFENRPLEKLFEDHFMYSTCLNEVEILDGDYKIVKYNQTDHYDIEVG